jgi:hypothetical protein
VENPFGASCESFTLCEANPAEDDDKDIYKMMCNRCSPGYISAGRLHEIQTVTTTGTGMTGKFDIRYIASDGVTRETIQVAFDSATSDFGTALASSISSSLMDGDITVKRLDCTTPSEGCKWEIHFMGVYGNLAMLSVGGGTLAGGSVNVVETQAGSDGPIDGSTKAGLDTNCADKRFQSYCYRPSTLDFCPPSTVCEYWFGGSGEAKRKARSEERNSFLLSFPQS